MSRRLTAGAPAPVLINALARAGWGDLAGAEVRGARGVLQALAISLPSKSATGEITVPQLMDISGYEDRWVRTSLARLEAMGLITWVRGGIREGRPQPSLIRIVKHAVLGLIHQARDVIDRVRAVRREITAHRISKLRMVTVRPRGSRRPPPHAALTDSPSPYRGRDAAGPSRPDTEKETSMRDPRWGTICDDLRCTKKARRPEIDGWTFLRGKHYCPDHDPLPRGDDEPLDPNSMTDAQLDIANRVRHLGGLPPLVRTLDWVPPLHTRDTSRG